MNQHFVEMLRDLSEAGADFLIIGAHAVSAHGHPRATKDIEIWIRPTQENALRVLHALKTFGTPLEQITAEDLSTPGVIFQIGVEPIRIDILTTVEPLDFEEAWSNRAIIEIAGGERFPFLGRTDLIRAKRAAGRYIDLEDLQKLEAQ